MTFRYTVPAGDGERFARDVAVRLPDGHRLVEVTPTALIIESGVGLAISQAMRRVAVLEEIYTIERWAAADDVGVQALHIIATHVDDGYGLASSTRREQPGG